MVGIVKINLKEIVRRRSFNRTGLWIQS